MVQNLLHLITLCENPLNLFRNQLRMNTIFIKIVEKSVVWMLVRKQSQKELIRTGAMTNLCY